jgi:hypothetical protein
MIDMPTMTTQHGSSDCNMRHMTHHQVRDMMYAAIESSKNSKCPLSGAFVTMV